GRGRRIRGTNMDINGITNTGSLNGVMDVTSGSRTSRTSSVPPPQAGGAASVNISRPGELLSKLQQLQQSDPDKFQQVVSGIADKLHTEAQNASGADSQALGKLADRFAQVAQTGDLSALQPKGGPPTAAGDATHHHHGHHRHSGGGGGGA